MTHNYLLMELYIPQLGKGGVRDIILDILIEEPKLSIYELYERISKKTQVSYQAVHKSLKELTKRNVLERKDSFYKINNEWIIHLNEFAQSLKNT